MKLFQITAAFEELLAAVPDDGELTPELAQAIESLELTLDDKVQNICHVLKRIESEIPDYKERRQHLQAMEKNAQGRVDFLKKLLLDMMQKLGKKKLVTDWYDVTACDNGQPSIEVDAGVEIADLPPELTQQVIEHKLNRDAVLVAYREGKLPPQVRVKYGSHVRIK